MRFDKNRSPLACDVLFATGAVFTCCFNDADDVFLLTVIEDRFSETGDDVADTV